MLPRLQEADPDDINTVPGDSSIGWDGRRQRRQGAGCGCSRTRFPAGRFEWPALRLIGKAQWKLNDILQAHSTWERVAEKQRTR